jgi:predicted amidohydrolase
MVSGPDRDANLDRARVLVAGAVAGGARLVVLPELFATMGNAEVLRRSAESVHDGPTITWARQLGRELGVWLVAGSVVERDGDQLYNTSALVGPDGAVVATYRKVHLFDSAVPGAGYHESAVLSPGDRVVVADVGGLRMAWATCYDLRFCELTRIGALKGANVLVVPAAFTAVTGSAHWELLVRARAVENQMYVVAAGQWGSPGPGLAFHGHSMVVDPWGTVLDEVGDGDGVAYGAVDPGQVAAVRLDLPALANRRPGAYDWS